MSWYPGLNQISICSHVVFAVCLDVVFLCLFGCYCVFFWGGWGGLFLFSFFLGGGSVFFVFVFVLFVLFLNTCNC